MASLSKRGLPLRGQRDKCVAGYLEELLFGGAFNLCDVCAGTMGSLLIRRAPSSTASLLDRMAFLGHVLLFIDAL